MPYYGAGSNYAAGDNYGRAGNYPYQAGGLFSFLGGIAKTVGGILPGPIGAIAKGVGGILAPSRPSIAPAMLAPPGFPPLQQRGLINVGPGGTPQTGLINIGAGQPGVPAVMGIDSNGRLCPTKGTRPNKSNYWKRIGGPGSVSAVLIPKGTVCVKTRRINIANPRALRRAVRRAQGFAKMARRVLTFVSAKAPKGRAKFKRAR